MFKEFAARIQHLIILMFFLGISACGGDTENPDANISPTANAGNEQTIIEGDSATLNGNGSSDSDGTIESYVWSEGGTELNPPAK